MFILLPGQLLYTFFISGTCNQAKKDDIANEDLVRSPCQKLRPDDNVSIESRLFHKCRLNV